MANFKNITLKIALALMTALALMLSSTGYSVAATAKDAAELYPQMDEECQIYKTAASSAMQNNLSMLDKFMTAAEKSMQRAVTNSCISSLAMLNLNLSSLIPDFNFFGQLLTVALQKFASYLTNKVCEAVGNVVGDWNDIVGAVNSNIDVNSAVTRWGYDVVQTYPGGSGGTGVGNSNSNATIELVDPNAQRPTQCISNNFGQICSDGSIERPTTDDSLSGSQIGAEYGRLRMLCREAVQAYYRYADYTENFNEETLNAYAKDVRTKCSEMDSFYSNYTSYLGNNTPIPWLDDLNKHIADRNAANSTPNAQ